MKDLTYERLFVFSDARENKRLKLTHRAATLIDVVVIVVFCQVGRRDGGELGRDHHSLFPSVCRFYSWQMLRRWRWRGGTEEVKRAGNDWKKRKRQSFLKNQPRSITLSWQVFNQYEAGWHAILSFLLLKFIYMYATSMPKFSRSPISRFSQSDLPNWPFRAAIIELNFERSIHSWERFFRWCVGIDFIRGSSGIGCDIGRIFD